MRRRQVGTERRDTLLDAAIQRTAPVRHHLLVGLVIAQRLAVFLVAVIGEGQVEQQLRLIGIESFCFLIPPDRGIKSLQATASNAFMKVNREGFGLGGIRDPVQED